MFHKKNGDLTSKEQLFKEDIKAFCRQYERPAFGNEAVLLPLIHQIGKGEGIGNCTKSAGKAAIILGEVIDKYVPQG